MNSTIEVVSRKDTLALHELAGAVYDNREPGFQIDDVTNPEELKLVFRALVSATPDHFPSRNFGHAELYIGAIARIRAMQNKSTTPHTDYELEGLAVHQNVTGFFPVHLATSIVGRYNAENYDLDSSKFVNLRSGNTMPGRLTVFSEGSKGRFPSLEPTIHFFDRRNEPQVNKFARYTQGGWPNIDRKILKAFTALETYS